MKLIGNTGNQIDWDSVIEQCIASQGNSLFYNKESFPATDDFTELDAIWQNAGYKYNDPSVTWTNYFPERNFNKNIIDVFESIVNAKPWMVWISKISVGQMAPWHFDAHSKIHELKDLGNPVRFTCYIQEPHSGHVSIVHDTAVYRPAKGSIYQWPSPDAWHCGMNGGLADKYMFNYWGYQ